MQAQTTQPFDTTSIISSTKSINSKRHSQHNNTHGDGQSIISFAPSNIAGTNPGPSKNSLSIHLAESAVFLRTNDLTGRNRYGDSRPAYLRGVVRLELVKPTRISRIVLELGAKVGTIWPEAIHGIRDLTETHKVFSASETVFSAIATSARDRSASRQRSHNISNGTSFVTLEDDSPSASPMSSPTITNISTRGWISSDVRSIQSGTSGTITPTTTRRALSADSAWTRTSGPAIPDDSSTSALGPPPPYPHPELALQIDPSNLNAAEASPNSPESPESAGGGADRQIYTESRISFQPGVNQSRAHAPSGIHHHHGHRSRSLANRAPPRGEEPNIPLPEVPEPSNSSSRHPYASPSATTSLSEVGGNDDNNAARSSGNMINNHYTQARTEPSRTQQSLISEPQLYAPHNSHSSHDDFHNEDNEPTRGRKNTRSRFSFANFGFGSKFIRAFSKSRSRSRGTGTEVSHNGQSQNGLGDSGERSASRVSTRSGVSGITTMSTSTKDTSDTAKSKRSLSLPWKRRRRRASSSTTTSGMSALSIGSTNTTTTTHTTNQTDEIGFLDISSSRGLTSSPPPMPPLSSRSYSTSSETSASTSASHTQSHTQNPHALSQPSLNAVSPSPRSTSPSPDMSSSHMNRRSPSSDARSHISISFADFAEMTQDGIVPSTPPSPSILSSIGSSITRPSSVLSRYSDRSRERGSSNNEDKIQDSNHGEKIKESGPGWREFPKGIYTYPILFPIPGHAPPSLDTAAAHRKEYGSQDLGVGGINGKAGSTGHSENNHFDDKEGGANTEALPRCTLKWQLKASVHRPGAFASKMQVTHDIHVVSGPSEDDGTAGGGGDDGNGTGTGGGGGGGETVIVERIWDGGVAAGDTSSNSRLNRDPPTTLMPPPIPTQTGTHNQTRSGRPLRPLPPPPPTASPIPPSPTSATFLPSTSSFLDFQDSPRFANPTSAAIPSSLPPNPPLRSPLPPPPFPSRAAADNGSGSLHYMITICGRSFPIGGEIPIEITLMPLEKVRVHRVGVVIEQKIEYHTQFKKVERTDPLLTVPLLSVKHESPPSSSSSKDKAKELKHILPLESDDPEALRKSPLYGIMRKSLMRSVRRGVCMELDQGDENFETDEAEEASDASEFEDEDDDDDDEDESDDVDENLDLFMDLDSLGSSESGGAERPQQPFRKAAILRKHKRCRLPPNALSSLASSLMGPGPWTLSLSLPVPITHASNLTPTQVKEHEAKVEDYRQQLQNGQEFDGVGAGGGFGGGFGSGLGYRSKRDSGGTAKDKNWDKGVKKKEKKPELVDVGRCLLPSNKNKRSNVTISHLLKCVIRVERGELEDDDAQDEELNSDEQPVNQPTPSSPHVSILANSNGTRSGVGERQPGVLADADRSGWDDEWEYVQSNKEVRMEREIRERTIRLQEPSKPIPRSKPKAKKKRKLFDIVVQTPIQILSCRCNPEFASLPQYTPHQQTDQHETIPASSVPSTASTSSSFNVASVPSTPGAGPSNLNYNPVHQSSSSLSNPGESYASIATDACPCIAKARLRQARRERKMRRRELRRELREQKKELQKFMERRRSRMLEVENQQRGHKERNRDRDGLEDEVQHIEDAEEEELLERVQDAERERRAQARIRRREALVALSSPPTMPLPPPPPLPSLTGSPLSLLPPPPPTHMDPPLFSNQEAPHQRTSISSANTTYTLNTASTTRSSYTSHTSHTNASIISGTPSILRNGKTKRSSGFSGLGFGGIITARPTQTALNRRLTGGSQFSQVSQLSYQSQSTRSQSSASWQLTSASPSPRIGSEFDLSGRSGTFGDGVGLQGLLHYSREFEDLVAGHMDEAGEAPPMYEHLAL
ncbi:hypothetical protein FB446DRAFT_785267 [Lentinula raphanica]|nr:hypothetical protein FB446DRAFT_785267 [Lentinula raphanica]